MHETSKISKTIDWFSQTPIFGFAAQRLRIVHRQTESMRSIVLTFGNWGKTHGCEGLIALSSLKLVAPNAQLTRHERLGGLGAPSVYEIDSKIKSMRRRICFFTQHRASTQPIGRGRPFLRLAPWKVDSPPECPGAAANPACCCRRGRSLSGLRCHLQS